MFIRMLKLPEKTRTAHDLSSLGAVHAAAPCPVEVKERMIRWWGPVLHEYYAGTEGNCFVYADSAGGWRTRARSAARWSARSTSCDEEGQRVAAGPSGHPVLRRGPEFAYHDDPDKTAPSRDPLGRGWTTLGDVGLRGRGGLPLPHRPPVVHDHQRRREHLSAGGREPPRRPSQGRRRGRDRRPGRRDGGGGQGRRPADDRGGGRGPSWSASSSTTAANTSRTTSARVRSTSCRAAPPPDGKLYKRLLRDGYWQGHTTTIL